MSRQTLLSCWTLALSAALASGFAGAQASRHETMAKKPAPGRAIKSQERAPKAAARPSKNVERLTRANRPAAKEPERASRAAAAKTPAAAVAKMPDRPKDGIAEARLLEIYRLVGQAETRAALRLAEKLVTDFPNFALAQLVYGDLLSARSQTISQFGNVSPEQLKLGASTLDALRIESQMRLRALRERPPAGAVPSELLRLSVLNKHAIAVDASRARLYLFENQPGGLKLLADYYISIGKLGLEKNAEGDLRTPLGVYFITSQLDPKTLKELYGIGALPINYPNMLDLKRGKTGKGIWLHGTPPNQFSRPPQDSDGCVVLANPDLDRIIKTVEIRSTPVVISRQLKWVAPESAKTLGNDFERQLQAWAKAKSDGNLNALSTFYAADFGLNGKTLTNWLPELQQEVAGQRGLALEIKNLNLLHWVDTEETMVATFGELVAGQRTGVMRRQYWSRKARTWKIFYEGVLG